MQQIGFLL